MVRRLVVKVGWWLAMRRSKLISTLGLLLFSIFTFQLIAAPVALAVDEVPSSMTTDQWKRFQKLDPTQKLEIRDAIISKNAKDRCGDFLFYNLLGKGSACEDLVKRASVHVWPTAEHALGTKPVSMNFCTALKIEGAPDAALNQCKIGGMVAAFKIVSGPLVKIALQQLPTGRVVLGLAEGGVAVAKFIADPHSELEKMANTAKAESVSSTQKVLAEITTVSSFDAGDQGFRSMWATFAGVGLVLMGLMIFSLHHSYSRGEISDDAYQNALMYYAPGGAILAIWGPPLMHQFGSWSSGLAAGTGAFAGSQVTDFIVVIARFGALESTEWFGPLIALLFFGLLLLGSWGVLIYLAMVPFLQASAALALALLIGMFLHPRTKPYALKIGFTVLALMFLKPVLYLLLGGVFWILAHQEVLTSEANSVLSTAVSLAVTAMVLIAVLFAPAAIFRLMPVMPAGDFQFGGGPNVAGAAVATGVGAAAGAVVSRSIASKRGGAPSSSRAGGTGSWGTSGGSDSSSGSPGARGPQGSGGLGGSSGLGPSGSLPGSPVPAAHKPPASGTPQKNNTGSPRNGDLAPRQSSDSPSTHPGPTSTSRSKKPTAQDSKPSAAPQGVRPTNDSPSTSSPSGKESTQSHGEAPSSGPGSAKSKSPSTGRALGAAAGAVARASVTPLQAGAVGALFAGREAARRAREASDAMVPKNWRQ